MLLVIAYSQRARAALRNAVSSHEDTVVRRFGRVVLLKSTAFGAFLACRFRSEYGAAVQVERVESFVPERDVSDAVRDAAEAYAEREHKSTSYTKFAANTEYPSIAAMKQGEE